MASASSHPSSPFSAPRTPPWKTRIRRASVPSHHPCRRCSRPERRHLLIHRRRRLLPPHLCHPFHLHSRHHSCHRRPRRRPALHRPARQRPAYRPRYHCPARHLSHRSERANSTSSAPHTPRFTRTSTSTDPTARSLPSSAPWRTTTATPLSGTPTPPMTRRSRAASRRPRTWHAWTLPVPGRSPVTGPRPR